MSDNKRIDIIGIWCCLFFLLVYLNRLIKKYFEKYLIPDLIVYLRQELYKNTIESIKVNFKEIDVGGIMTAFVFISSSLNNIIVSLFSTIIPILFTIIFMTIFILYCNPSLGLITLFYFILIIILSYVLIIKCKKTCTQKVQQFEKNNSKIEDYLKNISTIVIKSNTKENNIENIENKYKNKFINSLNCSLNINIIFTIVIILYFTCCMYVVITKQQKITSFIKISSLVIVAYITSFSGYLFDQLPVLMNDYELLQNTQKYYNKIIQKNNNKIKFKHNLLLKNINYSIDNKIIFKNLNIDIKKNDKIIILGESGTGKSTLMKLLLGFYSDNYNGEYKIDGKNIKNIDLDDFRHQINYCEQQAKLFDESVMYNINYGINVSISQIVNFINHNNISNLKSIIKQKNIGPNGYKISGGQKQMINIVKCFLQKKKIIFMDEPSSNLDDYHFNILINLINKTKNTTFVIITHDSRFNKIQNFKNYKIKNKNITINK